MILAGDVARPKEAIAWASGFTRPVLYVPGNHEFYGNSISGTLDELRQRCEGTRIRVLDNDEMVLDGVRFLGSTLWTDFRLQGEGEQRVAAMQEGQRFMRDFSRIRIGDAADAIFTPEYSAGLFERNAQWLAAKLASRMPAPRSSSRTMRRRAGASIPASRVRSSTDASSRMPST